MKIVLDEEKGIEAVFRGVSREELSGSIIVTGFRGFGMVGYLVSKYLALGIGAKKVGFISAPPNPPLILVEEDGVGFPYDVYFSRKHKTLIIVNRALPEKENADTYTRAIANFAYAINAKLLVLAGGLNKNFMEENDKAGYRFLPNTYYRGPDLRAPRMNEGLGVMGPLALLYIYSEYFEIPSVIILPYSEVEEADYEAALKGIQVIGEELIGVKPETTALAKEAEKYRAERDKILSMLGPLVSEQGPQSQEKEKHGGMYM